MLAAIRSRLVFAEQLRRRSSSRLTLIINVAQRLTAGVSALASSLVRFSATQDSGRRTHASAWYPFATRPDFGVAAYANNHDGIGITCIFRVRDVVNPRKRTWISRAVMSALCQKQTSGVISAMSALPPAGTLLRMRCCSRKSRHSGARQC